ncbi:MAG: phenylalanine--tRNA ligase subunit beta [Clostridia bacterium]|nr:phenylalanine--tRNA ligase subunit beta [Clostridia bacterium]
MYLPLSWLRELVELDGIELKTIEDGLFSCGLEVEEKAPVAPDISGVYVGRVKSIERHPDSDHMFVCIVDCGERGSDIQIVTGAQNVHAGDIVPAALDGAHVYGRRKGDDSRAPEVATIKNGKLRGIASNGMLCSGEELGIDDNWYEGASVNGIMMLPKDAPLGADVKTVLGLDDEVWDISVTANLPHCQHVYGVARELAALLDRPLHTPDLSYTPVSGRDAGISIRVDAPDLCPRYIGHYVYDVEIKKSPELIRRRLHMCGINAINTIVDITNYVLVEMGQPMHAFDLNNVTDHSIIVRRAEQDEKIVTLDEREFTLSPENLVICDAARPVALAGIMGGLNSEITDNTTEVLFEAAKFVRGNIRRTSRSLGQSSDSSHRFEKGVDAYTTGIAMQRALHLIEEFGCGKVGEAHIDVYAEADRKQPCIATTFRAINDVLGIEVPTETITAILSRMNYTLNIDGDSITATPPAYREDIEGSAADLAEDVIKMYGYDHIFPRFMVNASITAGGHNRVQMNTAAFKNCLCAQGFFETINYSFYSTVELDLLRLAEDAPERDAVRILNPLSEKYAIMRTTLVPSLLNVLSTNSKRGNENVRVYEIANIFMPQGNSLPIEKKRFCFALYGKGESFFTAKGVLEELASKFGLSLSYERTTRPFLHPGATAAVKCGKTEVGFFGQLSYEIAGDLDIAQSVFVGELDFDALLDLFSTKLTYAPVSPYRDIHRDLAVVAPESMTCGEIEAVVRSACKSVSEVRLFDIYRGGQVPEGHKSMAFALTFTPEDKELMPEDADKFMAKILKSLEYRLGLKIRS